MKTLSIIIPVYNEISTIKDILKEVNKAQIGDYKKEIVIVDDCSTDGSAEFLKSLNGYKIFFHKNNMGKTAAIKTALNHVTGDYCIIQDADLEYSPSEYIKLLKKAELENAEVIYGSRFMQEVNHRYHLLYLGNIMLSMLASLLFNGKVTDMETCYKLFKTSTIKAIEIESERFGFEAEVTAKLLRKGYKIHEVPISYKSRSFSEGKKIGVMDGIKAALLLIKYRFKK